MRRLWRLRWNMRLNPKKTKSMVLSRSRPSSLGYDDLSLGCVELEELYIVCVFLGSP